MGTLQDAYKVAIINEIKSQNLYALLAIAFENEESVSLFKNLEQFEKVHEDKLTAIYSQAYPDEELVLDHSTVHAFQEKPGLEDPKRLLEFAINKEIEASDKYREIAEQTGEEKIRRFFLELSREEENHRDILEKEIHRLQGTMMWFDEAELNGLVEH
ncbi:MAG: ferritin family protein [Candidatus Cloacimonetes bacterium]|nr:ferritin family protein [Candidatus Cloacimonadota bacterium]